MEQLLLHLWGDYITQTDWMAKNKTTNIFAASMHGIVYSIPFLLFLELSYSAFMVIYLTHVLIDHLRLARYVVFAKNWITDHQLKWADCNLTGYHKDSPPWLSFWLLIIADNTLHLTINYFSIKWL